MVISRDNCLIVCQGKPSWKMELMEEEPASHPGVKIKINFAIFNNLEYAGRIVLVSGFCSPQSPLKLI